MERKTVNAGDGEELSFFTAGSGRPVMLLHGCTMWSEMWSSNGVVNSVSKSARLIVPDMRGHGYSSKPLDPERYGMNLISDLVTILDHEEAGQVDIVGFSTGAELGLKLSATEPSRVASLLIIGSGWTQLEDMPLYRELAAWARETGKAMTPDPDHDALDAFVDAMPEIIGLPRSALEQLEIRCAGIVGGEDPHRPHLEGLCGVIPGFYLEILPGLPHETSWRDPSIPERIENFLMRRHG